MKLKSVKQLKNLAGKRVLLRLDVNVPLAKAKVSPEGAWRLERSLATIKYLTAQKAKVIMVGHLGRPEGKIDQRFSLLPVADYFSQLLKKKVEFWPGDFRLYPNSARDLEAGSVLLLENIRFEPREKKNCRRLARDLSRLADIYVNDAFGNIHRQDASMAAITYYLPAYSGLLLEEEVAYFSRVMSAKKGLVMIFGGAKAETKLKLIEKNIKRADSILLGGVLANTVLTAAGYNLGQSLLEQKTLPLAKKLLSDNLYLPLDALVATNLHAKTAKVEVISNISKNNLVLDIGPETVKEYKAILQKAKLVVWNGPFGYFENPLFVRASKEIMQFLVKAKIKTIIGGGETVELVRQLKLEKKFAFVSTGGGAMLAFLSGAKLPALERLRK
ncbi:MAG: phosphoglycerate kinase [Patescibacteria group bacterium]|nr:phosphoglycerate kinase [Patescibacteria group bacterium]